MALSVKMEMMVPSFKQHLILFQGPHVMTRSLSQPCELEGQWTLSTCFWTPLSVECGVWWEDRQGQKSDLHMQTLSWVMQGEGQVQGPQASPWLLPLADFYCSPFLGVPNGTQHTELPTKVIWSGQGSIALRTPSEGRGNFQLYLCPKIEYLN